MKRIFIAAAVLLTFALPAVPQAPPPDDNLAALVDRAVPQEIGNRDVMSRLLKPQVGRQLSDAFDEKKIEKFVDDKLPPDPCCKDDMKCTLQNQGGSALRVDLTRGKVRYSNAERSKNKKATSQPPDPTIVLARQAAAAFGIPAAEMSAPDFRYLRLTAAGMEERDRQTKMSFRAEGHVRFLRHIGGVPVAFSKFFVAVDSRGAVARAYARWPDFALTPGLRVEDTLSRQQVVEDILEELRPAVRPGTLSRILGTIVYAKEDVLEFGPEEGEDLPPDPDHHQHGTYVPALMVTLVPVAQREDAGVPQMPVQNLVFPLLGGPDTR